MTVADESEVSSLGWRERASTGPGVTFVETRSVTLTASGRHEHARWSLALEEAQSWTEKKEREVGVWWSAAWGGGAVSCLSGRVVSASRFEPKEQDFWGRH